MAVGQKNLFSFALTLGGFRLVPTDLNGLTHKIIGAAIEVHKSLGPGLLESTYEHCLMLELELLGLDVKNQVSLPICYKGKTINDAYRIDVLVNDLVILELKAVEEVSGVHKAQLLSYLKLSGKSVGLLLNFNVSVMRNGVSRFYNPSLEDVTFCKH